MTPRMTHAPRGPALPAAAIAALLLAGCSSGHVGDSWQCPLAEGGACDSVAAADPAVPDAGAARKTVLTEPLWRQRAGGPESPAPAPCEAECGAGFDPFGWLMRLFGADEEDGPLAKAKSPPAADAASPPETEFKPMEPDGDSLRTGEVVARIWIAPFVDADGVYREASHVRVVLAPAGWKLLR